MTSELVRPTDGPASPPAVSTYRTGRPATLATHGPRAVVLAALAAAETVTRLGRTIAIHSAAGALVLDLPEAAPTELRDLAGPAARTWLRRRVRPADAVVEDIGDALRVVGAPGVPARTVTPDTVRIDWTCVGDQLIVVVRCVSDDPWRRCSTAVAELFAEVLRELAADPAQAAGRTAGLGTASRRLLLTHHAGRSVDDGPFRAIPHLVEDTADRWPNRVAVSGPGRSLTYRQLDEAANGLATVLATAKVRRGDLVPVLLADGLELPVAYLAVLKLGAAFVPIDPRWPAERLRAVCDLVTDTPLLSADPGPIPAPHTARALVVDYDSLTPTTRRPDVVIGADDPIYGIFTSGTTGVPRCAVNRHGGLTNRFRFMTRFFQATGDEVVLQNSRHTFDSAVWQLFWPLTTGARVVLPAAGEFLDLSATAATIAAERVTMTDFVPSVLNALVPMAERDPAFADQLRSLRHLIVGGEEINPAVIGRLRHQLPALEVTNGYGPTETSIGMVFHRVTDADADAIPLGRPIDNCYAVVVDDRLRPLPPGATGEILIGGSCVGAGYHRAPTRTAEVFVANPLPGIPGDRLYRSGDLGWFDEQGRLRFAGRRDFQVKVNGVRVELGEVEQAAQRMPGVHHALALVTDEPTAALALFVAADSTVTQAALRDHLRRQLPRTSVPRHLMVLPSLPVTAHGKVDRRRLAGLLHQRLARVTPGESPTGPAPTGQAGTPTPRSDSPSPSPSRPTVTPPAAGTTADLASQTLTVFRSVLGQPDLPHEADFFTAGGDSLQALTVVTQLTELTGRPVDVARLFGHPSAGALAADLSAADHPRDEPELELIRRDLRPATPSDVGPADPGRRPRIVLLTGATGFVGSRLAYELLIRTDLQVWCAVRAASDTAATARVRQALRQRGLWQPAFAQRCRGYAMDLARPRLGLSAGTWARLAADVDLIVHNGALVNFVFDYRAHRPANVAGTAALLELAMANRPKPLHYISTLGVLQTAAACDAAPVAEDRPLTVDTLPVSGYSRSKWVAERHLDHARRRGATVTVLRLGEVLPSAVGAHPHRRALTHLLLTAFHRLGVRPDVVVRSDYTPVDYVARRVVASVTDTLAWGRTLHVFHPQSVCLGDVLSAAGDPIQRVGCARFLDRLEAAARSGDPELALLRRLLPLGEVAAPVASWPAGDDRPTDARGLGRSVDAAPFDESHLARVFSSLLSDNPRLFRKDVCQWFERRWGLVDQPLRKPVEAYRNWLGHDLRPPVPAGAT
ncbi:non-ribosomal peptide synthetase [Solwaraspora sp. WMMD406]|uniref:non-ribosomal peptide synthetase n=1 Tax=Solwaraspora sp. WMMD406 TaxID=3016095 RepID=UPI002415CD6B|nr:non-ribosomal peptide synthetase [Solwaraspora sp. WMMD406]MDG4766017.1 non-ribosomal peptide synthetase [Solwaraspora sp. WMMD406]